MVWSQRRVNLLEQAEPSILLKVEDVHVVELLADVKYAAIYDHIVLVDLGGVTASRKWRVLTSNLLPCLGLEVVTPDVSKLVVFTVLSSVNKHGVIVNYCGMACSWRGKWRSFSNLFQLPGIHSKV
jgi:hypothetical protein